jgi:hypothetical protein
MGGRMAFRYGNELTLKLVGEKGLCCVVLIPGR